MKPPPRRLLLWGALPVLLVALAVWSWTSREPTWEGHALSWWLEYEDPDPDTHGLVATMPAPKTDSADRAILGMGTNCLPFLLQRLRNPYPNPLERFVIKLEEKLEKHSIQAATRSILHR